ncbi:hypothetical protein [Lactococcus lactis]|uniref:hypothetical protein n=1 Tax=Lactococcus lactis TaxID=1358 RepID=UPI00204BA69C|nr:hypothetical protein [Lactococcus lactis]BDH82553.1 hypothetical protein LLL8_22100 [Lactococcus lactis]
MKIVLNKCFGGFSVSHEAKMMIFEKRGVEVFPYLSKFGDEEFIYEKLSKEKISGSGPRDITRDVTYFQKDPGLDSFSEDWGEEDKFDSIYLDFDDDRGNKDLVEVVEELGEKASGKYSNLKVVEIPDGASYEISDYDGIETAHYGFQTGSV